MKQEDKTNQQSINSIADECLEYMDINAYHLTASKNERTRQLNNGRIVKNGHDMEVEWGIVEISKLAKRYAVPEGIEEKLLNDEESEISPTLIYSIIQDNTLFFEEIDLYSRLPWKALHNDIYRPVVPLTPRQVSLLCSMVVNDAQKVDGVWVTSFPVKDSEPDWGKFKEIEKLVTSIYPNPCYELKKIRQPEVIDFVIREETVKSFSEQLKETRNKTFEYFRNISDFSTMLKNLQRSMAKPPFVKFLDGLLGDYYDTSLTNILDSTYQVYSLNYPQELYVNSVKDMVEHLKELLDNAVQKLQTQSDGEGNYSYEHLPELFYVINLVLQFLHDVVEIPQYAFHAIPRHMEF